MPGGKTKFQANWLELKDGNGDIVGNWCTQSSSSENEAHCLLCKSNFSVSNSGISQILQHSSTKKHSKLYKQMKNQSTLHVPRSLPDNEKSSSTLSLSLTADQLATRSEALWAIKVASSNMSFASCKDIVKLFQLMFNNNPIANTMKLSDRKLSYVISHGLSPFFHEDLLSNFKDSLKLGNYFTLMFDETTSSQTKKQLDIHLRFWGTKENKIVSAYLTSLFLGHADAETVLNCIIETLNENNISLKKLLMLSMDGPNVNLSIAKKINRELAKIEYPSLIDINTCTLHKVHNAFSKSLQALPLDIDEFATDLFSFFKNSPARREDLKNIESLLECEERFLLRHVNSRWVTLGQIVTRILTIYPAFKEYFLKFLPKKNSKLVQDNARYKRIVAALKNTKTVVYLNFISNICSPLENYLVLFQTEGPLIHLLYSKMFELLKDILLHFVKEELICRVEDKEVLKLDLEDSANFCPLEEIDMGVAAKRECLKLKETDSKNVKMDIRSFLIRLATNLKKQLPLNNELLRDLGALHPVMREEKKTDNAIHRICKAMTPLKLNDKDIDIILFEWKAYRLDVEIDTILESNSIENQKIDIFWSKIFEIHDKQTNKKKFSHLEILIKSCLSLSHGNADVERGFSINNDAVVAGRASMSEPTIIGIRRVKDAVRRYGDIFSIPISGKLLNSVAKSHAVYTAAKENEKKNQEDLKKKRQQEEEEKQLNETKKRKTEKDEKIKKINENIAALQNEIIAANKCLREGNERLQTALQKRDFSTMSVSTMMIDGATKKISKLTKELSSEQEALKKISK